jgi:hypothetical protein
VISVKSATDQQPLVMGVCRETFVVLAADRTREDWGGPGPERLLLHPTLPLAVAVTGLGELRDPRSGRPVDTHEVVRRVLAEMVQPNELALERIEARLANRLQPMVRETRRDPGVRVAGAVSWVDLLIGFHNGRAPGMGRLRVGEGVEVCGLSTYVDVPPELRAYYRSGAYAAPGAVLGERLSDPLFVAHHLRDVMVDGLYHLGLAREADVATITAKGARLAS